MDVEPVGQMDAHALVKATKTSILRAVEQYARSVSMSHTDNPPAPYFPDRMQPARRKPAPTPEPVQFRCITCGVVSKQQASCRLCGKAVMEKTRRLGSVLHLDA